MAGNDTVNIDVIARTAQAVNALGSINHALASTSDAAVATSAKTSGLDNSFQGIVASAGKFLGVVALMHTGLTAIGKAAEMETLETAFIPLLGSAKAAEDRLAELAAFAAATPFEMPEIANASRTLETLTRGALSTGEGLTLVGDVASGTNKPFSEIAVTVGRLYDGLDSGRPVGEAMMRLQELGVISGDVRGKIEGLQKEGKKGAEVWNVAEEALGRFSGSMQLQSQTWNGKLSTLSDNIGLAMAAFGEPIIDALKPFLDSTIDKTSSLADMATVAGSAFGELITELAPAVNAAIQGLTALGKFVSDNSRLLLGLGKAWIFLKGLKLAGTFLAATKAMVTQQLQMVRQEGMIKAIARAVGMETTALQLNTSAQLANNAAKKGGSLVGMTRATNPMSGGAVAGAGIMKGMGKGMAIAAAPMAIGMIGALSTTLMSEGMILGGKLGGAIADGLSMVLAMFGPVGIVAAIGIQLVSKVAYPLGQSIGQNLSEGINGAIDGLNAQQVVPEGFYAALEKLDMSSAKYALEMQISAMRDLAETSNDAKVAQQAASNADMLQGMLTNLPNLINLKKQERQAEQDLLALVIEKRGILPDAIREEMELLTAKIAGNAHEVALLEKKMAIEKEMAALKKDGLDEGDAYEAAARLVDLRNEEKIKTAEAKEEQQKMDQARKQSVADAEAQQKRVNSALEKAHQATVDRASAEQQIAHYTAQHNKLLAQGGGGSALEIARRANAAAQEGNNTEAERLLTIHAQLTTGSDKLKQLNEEKQKNDELLAMQKIKQDQATALLDGDSAAVKKYQDQIDMMERVKSIQEEMGVSKEQALRIAAAQTAEEKRLEMASRLASAAQAEGDSLQSVGGGGGFSAFSSLANITSQTPNIGGADPTAQQSVGLLTEIKDYMKMLVDKTKNGGSLQVSEL